MTQTAPADDPAVRALRLVSIVTWLPSLGLSVAHGVLSRQAYPSTGIIPHTVAAILAIFILRMPLEPEPDAESESDAESVTGETHNERKPGSCRLLHPFLVFLLDIAISAGFVWVLVKTWVQGGQSNHISMLAAYTTVPLMANFAASAGSGLHSIYKGLAINGFVQWIAWRAVPAECPNCRHNLRPGSLPEIPWLKRSKKREAAAPVLAEQERYHDESGVEEPGPETALLSGNNHKGKTSPANSYGPWGSLSRGS